MNFFGQLGSFSLSVYFGRLTQITHGFKTPLIALSLVLLLGAILWLFINPAANLHKVTS
jgi:hypothetical protein